MNLKKIVWRTALDLKTAQVVNLILEIDLDVVLDVYGAKALSNKSGRTTLAHGSIVIRKEAR